MSGVSTARKHFGIRTRTVSNFYQRCSFNDFLIENELQFYFYYQHLTEQEKLTILKMLFGRFSMQNNRLILYFTQTDIEQKLQFLQDQSLILKLLTAFLDLRWVSFFDAYMKKVPNCLELESVLILLYTCVKELSFKFAYKANYAQVCMDLIHLLHSKSLENDYSLDSFYVSSILLLLMNNKETEILEAFLECLSADNRRKLPSTLCFGDLQFVILNSTSNSYLFPSIDDRQNFLTNKNFSALVYSLIERKQLHKLDKIFVALFSNIGDIESFKKRFADERGFRLCQKFLGGKRWKCVHYYFKWSSCPKDDIIANFDSAISFAVRSRTPKFATVLMREKKKFQCKYR